MKSFKTRNKTIRRKPKNRSRKIKGGSLIGQGNFGCVFRPDILNGNKDLVSKIVLKNNVFNEYRHEYKILKKMASIDPSGKFHSLMTNATELTSTIVPPDFDKCSLSRPSYNPKDFFVFNMNFCGTNNLTYYLNIAFRKLNTGERGERVEPSILFTLLTNVIVGIKKMVKGNILHKTLDTDSIYLSEPITLRNPYCERIIDFGEGESRKYDSFTDKYSDYIILFNSIIGKLNRIYKTQHNTTFTKTILDLCSLFKELITMVNMPKFSQDELIKKYTSSLGTIFGNTYSKYAENKYK